jgi:hypothetical protein
MRIKTDVRAGYSLHVDEYVDATLAEPADCDALRIRCPVCQEHVVLETEVGAPCFRRAAPLFPCFEAECESHCSGFGPDYRIQHHTRARRRRLEFLHSNPFIELLGKDPLGPPYKDEGAIWEETPKLLFMGVGALSRMSDRHWRYIVRFSRGRFKDPVGFFASAENYLRSTEEKLPDVPESGLRRQMHLQVAFDLMQSLVAREGLTDEYDWLFVHAFRICLGRWAGIAEMGQIDQTLSEAADEDQQEHAAAVSILGWSASHLLSKDKKEVEKAIQALIKIETEPPIMEDRVPFLILFGSEIAGEMETTLYRLPYLPLLRAYDRPCRPLLT